MRGSLKITVKLLSMLTIITGIALLFCALIAVHYDETGCSSSMFFISMLQISCGVFIYLFFNLKKEKIKAKSGYLVASISWIYISFVGSLPFIFSGQGYSVMDSIFESFAAFTTTGCTVLDLEVMPNALIMWRAIANWLGGMGILVLLVSIIPSLGAGGQKIMAAETTGSSFEKLSAKYSDTGRFMYIVYLTFTVTEFILLWSGPLGFFDALSNTFSSISTGGLVIRESNKAAFSSVYTRIIVLIFTLMSSINYISYFLIYKGKFHIAVKNIETRVYLLIIVCTSALIALSLKIHGNYSSLWQAFKDSVSQVVSFATTTGHYVCNYTIWPQFTGMVLMILMFIGGCTMSTSGSLKVMRIIVLFKLILRALYQGVHPNAIKAVIVENKPVNSDVVSRTTVHIMLFFAVFIGGLFLLSFDNFNFLTTFSTTIGILSNTGLAFGEVGCNGYFGMFSSFSKCVMIFLMLAGRLEIYSILMIFTKQFWNSDKNSRL